MSVLIPTPAGHNHTTEVFKRTLSEASFLCNAEDTVAIHKMKVKKRGGWLYLGALVLLAMAAFIGLTGCSKADDDAPGSSAAVQLAEAKRAAAGAWACQGMTAVWLDEKTVQCLKEVK